MSVMSTKIASREWSAATARQRTYRPLPSGDRMRILIANDDGVYSPGICALAQCAAEFGHVRVVAPDVEMSSASHSITASRPLSYKRTPIKGVEAYRVN